MKKAWKTVCVVLLVTPLLNIQAGADSAAWFELDPDNPAYISPTKVAPHSTARINLKTNFDVYGVHIGAIKVDNSDGIAGEGVSESGALNEKLMYDPLISQHGEHKDGGVSNIVVFQISGSIQPGSTSPDILDAGEVVYSFEVATGEKGSSINIDDYLGANPFEGLAFPLKTAFGHYDTNNICPLNLTVDDCACAGDLDDDGWVSPADVSALVSHLLAYDTSYFWCYWDSCEVPPCIDMDDDGWMSPMDVSAIVSELLPYASIYYWKECPRDDAPPPESCGNHDPGPTGEECLTCPGDTDGDNWLSRADTHEYLWFLSNWVCLWDPSWCPISPCGDVDEDDWMSPIDISAIVSRLLPYENNYYWRPCEQ